MRGARGLKSLNLSQAKSAIICGTEYTKSLWRRIPSAGVPYLRLKKRQQNLEYEFKQLKLKVRKTGEDGFLKITRDFPYSDIMDEVLGHRDNIDLDSMELEGSSVLAPPSYSLETPHRENAQSKPPLDDQLDPLATTEKAHKGRDKKKDARDRKRKRDEAHAAESNDFLRMWQQSMEAEAQRFDRCMEMQQEMQRQQMEQSAAMLSGFKDLFKEILKKD